MDEQPDARSHVVLHERIATIEEQLRGVKENGAVVRSTLHEVNNNMQQFVIAERECGLALKQLLVLTKDLPTIAATALEFTMMKVKMQEVIDDQSRRKGAWGVYVLLGTMIMGAVAMGAALGTVGMWLEHLR